MRSHQIDSIAAIVAAPARARRWERHAHASAGSALHLRVGSRQHFTPIRIASSHAFAGFILSVYLSSLPHVKPPNIDALVLEHLVELLGARISILFILMNQDWPDNELIEALKIVGALVLLGLLFVIVGCSFKAVLVSRGPCAIHLVRVRIFTYLLIVVQQRLMDH